MKLHATVSCPQRGVYVVEFDFLSPNGVIDRQMPCFSLPAESYEHARAIEQAYANPPKVKG